VARAAVKVFLLTCTELPEPDADAPILAAALSRRGLSPTLLAWDDPAALATLDRAPGALVVVRSTWNYYLHHDAFLQFVQDASTRARLCNPPEVIRWNTDKIYLRALADRGIPVVPTRYLARGASDSLAALMDREGFADVVVKPRVSAGSFETHRIRRSAVAAPPRATDEATFRSLLAQRDLMVQPYVASVDTRGERSIVCFEGEVSHAIRKSPRFAGGAESVRPEPVAPEEADFARGVLAAAGFGRLLYARVDIAEGAAGELLLMELELTEPSLFLLGHEAATDRFADAIAARAR
jgi:glutathione synthase/RimK-type ligase-like ATP-grasp enzyme